MFLSRNYGLMVASPKFDVLKTNIESQSMKCESIFSFISRTFRCQNQYHLSVRISFSFPLCPPEGWTWIRKGHWTFQFQGKNVWHGITLAQKVEQIKISHYSRLEFQSPFQQESEVVIPKREDTGTNKERKLNNACVALYWGPPLTLSNRLKKRPKR